MSVGHCPCLCSTHHPPSFVTPHNYRDPRCDGHQSRLVHGRGAASPRPVPAPNRCRRHSQLNVVCCATDRGNFTSGERWSPLWLQHPPMLIVLWPNHEWVGRKFCWYYHFTIHYILANIHVWSVYDCAHG